MIIMYNDERCPYNSPYQNVAASHPFISIQSVSKVFGIIAERLFQIIYLSELFELPQY